MLFTGLDPVSPGQMVQLEAKLSQKQDIEAVPCLRL